MEHEHDEIAARSAPADDRFTQIFRLKSGTAASPGELDDLRRKSEGLEKNLGELGPQIDAAKQRLEFLTEEHKGRLGDYLNQPANARRLFDAQADGRGKRSGPETRARLLEEWVHRLEERDLLFHVLAGYEFAEFTANIARQSTCSS